MLKVKGKKKHGNKIKSVGHAQTSFKNAIKIFIAFKSRRALSVRSRSTAAAFSATLRMLKRNNHFDVFFTSQMN